MRRSGGFAHDTGEGGLSPYHLENGGDIVWEIGTGYFGARTKDGDFDPASFSDKASGDSVKCVSLKLSQGAKPGIGGVLPAAKVSQEIADIRQVPQGEKCVSPPSHRVFHTPVELIEFIARMRELAGGKPTGFKLCVGSRVDVLAMCKAMVEVGTTPDFIVVDGSEGGTGAAPLEFEDHVGMPLTHGLMTVHNALVGVGLRDRVRIGASGKVAAGNDIVKRLIQGADYTNSARAMMMAAGCIQAQRCHTDKCPSGVATQNARRARALDVGDKSERVHRYQQATVDEAMRIMAAMGDHRPGGPDAAPPAAQRVRDRQPVLCRALRLARPGRAAGRAAAGLGPRLGHRQRRPLRRRTPARAPLTATHRPGADLPARHGRTAHDHRRRAHHHLVGRRGRDPGLGCGRRRPQPADRRDPHARSASSGSGCGTRRSPPSPSARRPS